MNLRLDAAQQIIVHLITWGEISGFELKDIANAQDWLPLFESAGVVCLAATGGEGNAWSLSTGLWSLLEIDEEKAFRTILFQITEYREYLISVLAEGVASAAKQKLYDEVENWSGSELLPFLSSINRMLTRIEVNGKRVIDEKAAQIPNLFAVLPERQSNWDTWNQLLLGRSARPQDLFDFVMKRFIPFAVPEPAKVHGGTPAILPMITLQDADGNARFLNITPVPWNISRTDVQSSIALFGKNGKPLQDFSTAGQCKVALQDALIEQPFYKVITQLAINHYRAKTASSPSFELYLRPGAELSDIVLFYESERIGSLKEWLPVLVQCQKYFAARPLNDELVGNMVENLLTLEVLDQSDDSIVLHSDFQSTLMASRLRSVFRPGKLLQGYMIEAVRKNLQKTAQQEVKT